jgi:hypothetical protein
VAFETYSAPAVFFTTGYYSDYHKPTDTPDRLDYDVMAREAEVVLRAVSSLEEAGGMAQAVSAEEAGMAELRAVRDVLSELVRNPDSLGVPADSTQALAGVVQGASELLKKPGHSPDDRRRFLWSFGEAILPVLLSLESESQEDEGEEREGQIPVLLTLYEDFRTHRNAAISLYRDVVRHFLKNPPRLFSEPKPYDAVVYDLADDEVSLARSADGRWRLDVLLPTFAVHADLNLWTRKGGFGLSTEPLLYSCSGTIDEITDFCLLRWRRDSQNPTHGDAWSEVLTKVTGFDAGPRYNDWLAWRLERTSYEDESAWELAILERSNPELLRAALQVAAQIAPDTADAATARIIRDTGIREDARSVAIGLSKAPETLIALADVLADSTPLDQTAYNGYWDPSYVLYDHPYAKLARWVLDRWLREGNEFSATIGEQALKKLKAETKQNFGADADAWRGWIENHPSGSE